METEFIKKVSLFLIINGMCTGLISCKHDDDFPIIDYYPVVYEILVVNSAGDNLLEESTLGNILDTEMYIELAGERYDVEYGCPDNSIFPYPPLSRAYMPTWYGAFISPYCYSYPDLPQRENYLYVGEFHGDASGKVTFELYLDGHTYEISYLNKKISGSDVSRRYYLDGKEINSSSFTLIL